MAPVIGSLIVPIGILDVWVTLYQLVCFPVFGIALVRRGNYIVPPRDQRSFPLIGT